MFAYLLLFITIGIYTCQSFAASRFPVYYPGKPERSSPVFSVLYGLSVTVITFAIALVTGASLHFSWQTLLMGLVNGIVLALYNLLLLRTSSMGPYSIVMLFLLAGGICIPMFYSLLRGVALPLPSWIGIGVMLAAFLLINLPGRGGAKISGKFLAMCIVLGFVNGLYGIFMDAQQRIMANSENAGMIIMTFGVSALASLLFLLPGGSGSIAQRFCTDFRLNTKAVLWAAASSLSAATGVNFLMYLLGKIPAAVVYAMTNGGVLLCSVVISLLFLHERATPRKLVGLFCGLCAIVLLSI